MNTGIHFALTEPDLAAFKRLGIGQVMLERAQVCRVTNTVARNEFGMQASTAADLAGIVFPYLSPKDGNRLTARLRRDHPERNAQGQPRQKYLCPWGDARHLYFPPGAGSSLADTACPAVIVEAEKSALALAALAERIGRKMLPVGTGGCWGWRGQIGIEPDAAGQRVPIKGTLPDWDLMYWAGRDAVICFDANAASNPKVGQARRALADELEARGARVCIAQLPVMEGVNGPDDLIAVSGDAAMLALLDAAAPAADTALADAEAAVCALENNPESFRQQSSVPITRILACVPDAMRREILAGRAAKAIKTSKAGILGTLECERREIAKVREQAAEKARKARLLGMEIDLQALIVDLERYFAAYAYLPSHAALTLALWAINSWVFDVFDTTPYLLLESPVPQSGKTTVLRLLEAVAREPRQAMAASEAALFRMIEAHTPTLFIDEAEMLAGKSERADCIRAIANAGYKRGGEVPRCTGEGAAQDVKGFKVYCPKAFAAIGGLRDALLDRCIVISMGKRPAGVKLKPVKEKQLRRVTEPLRERLEAYALQKRDVLAELYEHAPDEGSWPSLADREAELWEPLLHHARLAGPETEARALEAALGLSNRKQEIQAEDLDFSLARELYEALQPISQEWFGPGDLIESLAETETWGARLADKLGNKSKAAQIGYFIRKLRLQTRQRTRQGTRYSTQEALEKLRAIVPEKPATPATSATDAEKSTVCSVADNASTLQPAGNSSATDIPAVAGDSGPVADVGNASATPKTRINGGVVADVAGVAGSSGDREGYWGEI